jgi:predicted NBD/HSP70 family sugar kinase
LLEFNPDAAFAVGASMRDHRWRVVMTNLDAKVCQRLDIPILNHTPEAAVAALQEGVASVMSNVNPRRVLPAIGLGTPGLVDMRSGVIKTAVDVGWFDVPIRRMVEEKLSLPTFVANRSKVGALAEYLPFCPTAPPVVVAIADVFRN